MELIYAIYCPNRKPTAFPCKYMVSNFSLISLAVNDLVYCSTDRVQTSNFTCEIPNERVLVTLFSLIKPCANGRNIFGQQLPILSNMNLVYGLTLHAWGSNPVGDSDFLFVPRSWHADYSFSQVPTLLDVTCCVRLHTLLHIVACCCVLLGVVVRSLNPVKRWLHANGCNNSQHWSCCVRLQVALGYVLCTCK